MTVEQIIYISISKYKNLAPDESYNTQNNITFTSITMLPWSILLQILLTWLSIASLFSIFKRTRFSRNRLPPGPIPYPVVGNLFSVGPKPHVSLAKLAESYGDIISLQLGTRTTVVVSSAVAAKLVLLKHDAVFSNRAVFDSHSAFDHNKSSVVGWSSNERWRMLRKICVTHVFNNSRLDASREIRRLKVQQLLDYIKDCSEEGKAVNIGEAAFTMSLNFLTNTIFSMDMADPRSEKASEMKKLVWGMMEEGGATNVADFYPVLKFADPQGCRKRMGIHMGKLYKIFDDITEERLKTRGNNGDYAEEKDVLDALINIAHDKDSGFYLHDIRHLLLDLIGAGTDTTSSTIEWTMTELLRHPTKLHRAQAEVRSVVGGGNSVEESDSARLPYLQAVIKETLRLHPPVPFLVPRTVLLDAELNGYSVPKNSQVFVNVWAMGRDENVWKNAEEFEPDRFIDSELDYKGRDYEFVPFGAGRRICPGLPLGNRMLHLVLGSLLHEFDWKAVDGSIPDIEEKFGFTLQKAKPLFAVPIAI